MTKEQSPDLRRGRLAGRILPEDYKMTIEEAEAIGERGGIVVRLPTGKQVGIRFPEPEDNGSQSTTKRAKTP